MADISAVKELTDRLENGMKDLFESDKYAAYLQTMSRFHRYSTRNTLLIHLQMPTATRCAGYNDWKNKFKRQVKKGEHGIKIFAPMPFIVKEELEKLDPVTKQPVLGEDGQPVMEEYVKFQSARFKVVPVFDISQTDGEPLPELVESLTGDVARYELFLDALRAVSPLPIVFEDLPDDTDGVCHFGDRISIRNGMSEIQTVSAVIHEMAHAKLHDLQVVKENGGEPKDRRTEEVEAESISYAVCQYYGIETGANSFGYLAEWSKTRELKELNASLDTIRKTAAELLDGIDEQYRALAKERGIDLSAPVPAAEQTTLDLNPELSAPAAGQESPIAAEPTTETQEQQKPDENDTPQSKGATMEYSESQLKGFAIARRYENLPLQDRIDIIARTFGCKTAKIETVPCTGKYRGYSDIHLTLDNGSSLGIGMHRTPQAKTMKVINKCVNDTLARYNPELVRELKTLATAALTKREAEDNTVAAQKGLKPYTFLNVELNDGSDNLSGGHLGWFYVTLAVEGKIFAFIETGLNYDIAHGTLGEHSSRPNYFVAGGLRDNEVDFVFNNVGHSSFNGSHQINLNDNARERAEKRLSELKQQPAVKTEARNTMENKLFDKFAALFPDSISGKYSYMRLESGGFEPLSIEWIGGNRISIMHTYTMNGDLMYDPMMTFDVDREARTMTAAEYEMSMPPLYQRVDKDGSGISVDGNGREQNLRNLRMALNGFASEWFGNIEQQRFKPVRANMEIDGEETQITFDKDGNPILPEPPEPIADTLEHKLYNKFTDMFPQFMGGEYSTLRLEAEHAKPLTLEWVFGDWISISHTYELNGEPAYEPMVMLAVNSEEKTMTARSLDLTEPPRNDVVYRNDDPPDLAMQQNINNFTSQWLDRAEKQGFKPVEATVEIDGEDVRVTFDKDGNIVLPEADAIPAPEEKPRNLPGYSDDGKFIRQFAVWNKHVKDVSAELKTNDVTFTFAEGYTDYLTFFVIPNEADAVKCKDALIKLNVENLFNVSEGDLRQLIQKEIQQKPEKQYELGFGFLGNGLTVWNRLEERNGDYVTVAHIETDRTVTYYDKDMPHEVKERIEAVAKSPETKGFGFATAPENVPPHIIGASAPPSVYEAVKRVMPETAKPKVTELDLSQPDPTIGYSEMNLYGYAGQEMLPLLQGRAVELFDTNHPVYLLYPDNTEAMALDRDEILNHDGLCGIESADWERSPVFAAQMAIAANAEGKREADLLYGDGNRFGIYQIKDGIDAARDFRFAPMRELEALGLTVDRANYELVYAAPFSERIEFLSDRYPLLNKLYEQFNIDHPADFIGHSLSVSDVVVLKCNGDISSHFVDSVGFAEIDGFLGEESHHEAVEREAERTDPTFSQVGNRSDAPTVAELEADAKAGKVISLSDLAKAVNAERKPPLSKGKPSLLGRLEENKHRAARQGQPETRKNDGLEV